MKFKTYWQVRCPKCGYVMLNDEKHNTKCINDGCTLFEILYEAPIINLKKVRGKK